MPPKKKPSLKAALTELRTKNDISIGSLKDFDMTVKAVSTGNIKIDAVTGVGGIPRGRVTEAFGPPSSGKTTTGLQAAADLQRELRRTLEEKRQTDPDYEGRVILFMDYEKALDPAYCANLGLDTEDEDTFLYMQPRSLEQGWNTFRKLMRDDLIDMLIVDSVALMVSEKELEVETGKANVADRAKMLHQAMRQTVDEISRKQVVVYFLNHVQEVIDASPMGQKLKAQGITRKTTPGGTALKFNASLRLEFKQIGNLRTSVVDPITNEKIDSVEQTKVQVTAVKNKVAPPFRQCEVRVRFGRGFSQAWAVFDTLISYGVIDNSVKGTYRLTEETAPFGWDLKKKDYIRGEEAFIALLERDDEWLERLTNIAGRLLQEHGAFVDGSKYDPETGDEVNTLTTDIDEEELQAILASESDSEGVPVRFGIKGDV